MKKKLQFEIIIFLFFSSLLLGEGGGFAQKKGLKDTLSLKTASTRTKPIHCSGGIPTCGCDGLTTMTDPRDGKIYNIVQIGTQCWMAQNLDYGTYVTIAAGQNDSGTQKYCYGDNIFNCNIYGGLYEWSEMMNGSAGCNGDAACPPCITPVQGVCPAGWHIPAYYELTLLEKSASVNPDAFPFNLTAAHWLGKDEGGRLKQAGTSNWESPNTGAINAAGFSALPGGDVSLGSSHDMGIDGYWWTATESGNTPWLLILSNNKAQVLTGPDNIDTKSKGFKHGFSVRCVKN